ncbi:hypothetical protein [Roseimaritima ulvae]|uniref:hypothetical protein n=1 Tax=Roseimaritima ulvae TaxID=980254 RepID=UPI000833CC21|nr:hypothetical protein [Roseimaritima ulvae]
MVAVPKSLKPRRRVGKVLLRAARCGPAPRSALTLLEVLLALAIMTAVAAFALPMIDGMLVNRRLVRGAEVVRVHMMNARLEAMRSGRTHLMRCPVAGTEITTYVFRDLSDLTEAADQLGSGTALLQGGQPMAAPLPTGSTEPPRAVELPEGITIGECRVESTTRSMIIENQTMELSTPEDNGQPIMFYPDGTTSNAAVTVRQGQQGEAGRIVVVLRGLTGEATVGEELP